MDPNPHAPGYVMSSYRREKYKTISEDWNEYQTESGLTVRVRLIVGKIETERDDDDNLVVNDNGDPSVRVSLSSHIAAHQT